MKAEWGSKKAGSIFFNFQTPNEKEPFLAQRSFWHKSCSTIYQTIFKSCSIATCFNAEDIQYENLKCKEAIFNARRGRRG
jgi:hypothetical protein